MDQFLQNSGTGGNCGCSEGSVYVCVGLSVLACTGAPTPVVSPPRPSQGEIPKIQIMYNDIEHSISIDFDIYIYIFQVFSLFIYFLYT
jgi:hypothetical protein